MIEKINEYGHMPSREVYKKINEIIDHIDPRPTKDEALAEIVRVLKDAVDRNSHWVSGQMKKVMEDYDRART